MLECAFIQGSSSRGLRPSFCSDVLNSNPVEKGEGGGERSIECGKSMTGMANVMIPGKRPKRISGKTPGIIVQAE